MPAPTFDISDHLVDVLGKTFLARIRIVSKVPRVAVSSKLPRLLLLLIRSLIDHTAHHPARFASALHHWELQMAATLPGCSEITSRQGRGELQPVAFLPAPPALASGTPTQNWRSSIFTTFWVSSVSRVCVCVCLWCSLLKNSSFCVAVPHSLWSQTTTVSQSTTETPSLHAHTYLLCGNCHQISPKAPWPCRRRHQRPPVRSPSRNVEV